MHSDFDSVMDEKYFVVAVLVTYNPDVVLFKNVVSNITRQVDRLIVIDNNSLNTSKLIQCIEGADSITYKSLSTNIGLAAAQNMAMSIAKGYKASHVILFDQDSLIPESFILKLLECEKNLLAKGEKVAAVGPSFFDPVSGQLYPATLYKGPFIKRIALSEEPVQATFIIASGCLIRMNVLDDVGFMRDELFIDYIDVEWSLRAQAKGYGVYITPQARMAHTIGDRRLSIFGRTISVHSPLRRYYLVRNSFLMLRLDYIPWGYKLRELVFNFVRTGVGFCTATQKMVFCKYFSMALRDGLLGRFGPCPKIYK